MGGAPRTAKHASAGTWTDPHPGRRAARRCAALLALAACGRLESPPAATPLPRAGSAREMILATTTTTTTTTTTSTTSTQDSGLLDVLVPRFEQQTGYQIKTASVGTGAALALGARGEADVLLVHAPDSEQAWMARGYGTRRALVMHNDFVLVGPPDDPAGARGAGSAVAALTRVAGARAAFISRGDGSGTQQAERALWQQAAVEPRGQPWYVESGSGMAQTLTIADQKRAYTLADRATWLTWQGRIDLPILVEGDPTLFNVYHVLVVNAARFPFGQVNTAAAQAFADFLLAPDTQRLIGSFGLDRYGQALFVPDAGKAEEEDGG